MYPSPGIHPKHPIYLIYVKMKNTGTHLIISKYHLNLYAKYIYDHVMVHFEYHFLRQYSQDFTSGVVQMPFAPICP